jgi:2,3-bisphosphoglycerate-dependent phosphoglycerate mutase
MMRILWVRHAETFGNRNENAYTEYGDEQMPITDIGWGQAQHMGRFLRGFYQKAGVVDWPTLYLSLYLRPRQTLAGAMHGLGDYFPGTPKLNHDPRLIEKHFGAANFLKNHGGAVSDEFARNMIAMSDTVYNLDPYTTSNILGESSKDTMGFIRSFFDGALVHDMEEGKEEFIIITHGAVIKDSLLTWFHVPFDQRDKIDKIGNCDVIDLSGNFGSKKWTATKIYDGEKMEPVNINVIRRVKRFTVDDLPGIPAHLKVDFE